MMFYIFVKKLYLLSSVHENFFEPPPHRTRYHLLFHDGEETSFSSKALEELF